MSSQDLRLCSPHKPPERNRPPHLPTGTSTLPSRAVPSLDCIDTSLPRWLIVAPPRLTRTGTSSIVPWQGLEACGVTPCCPVLLTASHPQMYKRNNEESFVYAFSMFLFIWLYLVYKNSVILHKLLGSLLFFLPHARNFSCSNTYHV